MDIVGDRVLGSSHCTDRENRSCKNLLLQQIEIGMAGVDCAATSNCRKCLDCFLASNLRNAER